jgi:5'-phosphate synthase pdxT subunit
MERVSSSQHVRPAPFCIPGSGIFFLSEKRVLGYGHGESLDRGTGGHCKYMAIHGKSGAVDRCKVIDKQFIHDSEIASTTRELRVPSIVFFHWRWFLIIIMTVPIPSLTVGVLALQGAFSEHIQLLRRAAAAQLTSDYTWRFVEVRTPAELSQCDGLIIPGGESTAMSLVAARSGLLEPLRDFVKVRRRPTWGTCAGLILLAESANRTKKGGQELVGGLDVRVNRNHFGRQQESFQANLNLPFLGSTQTTGKDQPYRCVFIRAPVVEKVLPRKMGEQLEEADTVVAPSKTPVDELAKEELDAEVEVMATLSLRNPKLQESQEHEHAGAEDIIAVRQGNVFGCSFHPELTEDPRIHVWWLEEVIKAAERRQKFELADRTK